MNDVTLLGAALVVDALMGDPRWLPHPVILMGKMISYLEGHLNNKVLASAALRWRGVVTVFLVVSVSWSVSWGLIYGAGQIDPVLGWSVALVLFYFSLAGRSLAQAAIVVARPLGRGDLIEARRNIAMFVGRDTDQLQEADIARATVETVAENFTDGYVAPLLFGIIGGAPLAIAYKAVNTMDSMLGYKNERYLHFGWAAARLDDLANFIPARVAAVFLLLAGGMLGKRGAFAMGIWARDAAKHPSPNGGATEAVMAGLLGVALGGVNYYGGIPSERGVLGDAIKPLSLDTIRQGLAIYAVACLLVALGALLVVYLSGGWLVPFFRMM